MNQTELVYVLRYILHFFLAKGIHSEPVKPVFLAHTSEEEHARDLASLLIKSRFDGML